MIPEINFTEFLLWILGRRKRVRVTGNSMLPVLKPGEEVLIDPQCYQKQFPQVGDIVVAQHPMQQDLQLIKRVTVVLDDGHCFLQGDNPQQSTDSRSFGMIHYHAILGGVTSRFA